MSRTLKAALIIAAVLTVVYLVFGPRTTPTSTPTASHITSTTPHPVPPATAPPPGRTPLPTVGEGRTGKPAPSPTVTDSGADDHPVTLPAADAQAATTTAQLFVTGWLTPDPAQRHTQLASVTAPALLEQLTAPHLRIWTTTPAGPTVLHNQTATAATVRQRFTDGRSIDMLLLLDPAAAHGWLVTDVAPVR